MINLKSCPFCGGECVWCSDESEVSHPCHFIVCTGDCRGSFDMAGQNNPEELEDLIIVCAETWNKRINGD